MSRDFEARLADWAVWYHEHVNDGGDVHRQVAFLKKAVDGTLELLAIAAQDIQDLEGRPKRSPLIWTPFGQDARRAANGG
jgi:hypothetical protein